MILQKLHPEEKETRRLKDQDLEGPQENSKTQKAYTLAYIHPRTNFN